MLDLFADFSDDFNDFDDEEIEGEVSLTKEEFEALLKERAEGQGYCEAVPYNFKETKKRIAVVDTETDPFAHGLIVAPFSLGFYDGERYVDFWGDNCVDEFFAYLATLDDEYIIYAHNGGKFDFFFFLKHMDADQSPLIMGGRLTKIKFGGQEFRDSYAIIPQPLSSYKKDEIDYQLFTREKREKHRVEILKYLRGDCVYLYDLIIGFHNMFGDKVTIAGAALPMLNNYHGFAKLEGIGQDELFRRFYYGGRNQCFETGLLKPRHGDKFYVYDRNSMYPAEMRDTIHPIGNKPKLTRTITENSDFACIEALNDGALPYRDEKGGLDFTVRRGTFWATIHEINAGIETGTLKILRVKHAWEFDRKSSFATFVDEFYSKRMAAKLEGNEVENILYKLCLNSPYGKFALNPLKFREWKMTIDEIPSPLATLDKPEGWSLHSQTDTLMIWSRPNPRKGGFYNVATAASITGAARANLLRNISLSRRPIYCDTDSIICEGFNGDLDDNKLGGWKLEATGDRVAIGGKKLYTVFDSKSEEWIKDNRAIKKASKGARLTPREIVDVCDGREVIFRNPVPNFKLDGSAQFITRRINRT